MSYPQPPRDPANKGRPFLEESDIGSGEKTPGEQETEEMIRQIPPLPPRGGHADSGTQPAEGDRTGNPSAPQGGQ